MGYKTMSQVNTIKTRLQVFLEQAFLIPACPICSAMHQVRLTEAKNSIFPSKCPNHWLLKKKKWGGGGRVGEGTLPPTLSFFFFIFKGGLKCQVLKERASMPSPKRKWKIN